MRYPTFCACLCAQLFFATQSAQAQLCKQVIEVGAASSLATSVAYDSGVALYSQDELPGLGLGQVEVYEQSPVSGVFEFQQILRADPVRVGEEHFGVDVDTDGETIIVGSDRMNFPGEGFAAYVFEKNQGLQTWEQVAKFVVPGISSFSSYYLGDVAVSGDYFAIGSPFVGSGEVHLFKRDSTSGVWSFDQTIQAPGISPGQLFGMGLDIDGDVLAIGAPGVNSGNGLVHVYELSPSTGDWHLAQDLVFLQQVNAMFGSAIAVQGNRLLAGAPGYGFYEGAAELWSRTAVGSPWQVEFTYLNFFAAANSSAGAAVALDGDNAYIAVPHDNGPPRVEHVIPNSGGTGWIMAPVIGASSGGGATLQFDFNYAGMGASDGQLVAGGLSSAGTTTYANRLVILGDSDQDCDGNGLSDRCEISNGAGVDTNGNGILDVCEGIGSAYCQPTAINSVGLLGQLSADGSHFVSENNITLRADRLPPNQFGYTLNSPYQGVVANPGGSQGNLCIFGPSLGRHNRLGEVRHSGAMGEFDFIVDLTDFPSPMGSIMVQAGETWNFQVWYRDQNPSNASNLTNAVSLTFQ